MGLQNGHSLVNKESEMSLIAKFFEPRSSRVVEASVELQNRFRYQQPWFNNANITLTTMAMLNNW